MSEPNNLSRKVDELKEWQRVAWRRVADPFVTEFERREIRNHIKESDGELGYYLGMVSERLRFRGRKVEDVRDSLAKLNFRLFLNTDVSSFVPDCIPSCDGAIVGSSG
jgi:hypothetical protein